MAEIVRMPKLSDTMTEGVVAQWHKKVGEEVSAGDLLADIETDKATMEFESFQDGVLLHQGVGEGETAPVNSILAILGEKGEDIKSILEDKKNTTEKTEEKVENTKEQEDKKSEEKPSKEEVKDVAEKDTSTHVVAKKGEKTQDLPSTNDGNLKISPLAKRLANEKNINLNLLKGTGDGGRIIKRDIDNYSASGFSGGSQVESYSDVPNSQMRKTIARRLSESKYSAPHFYLTMDIDMDEIVKSRKMINEISPVKISFNDLVVKAAARALQDHPAINATWLDDKIRYNNHVHIGVAIAVPDGLVVPVVRFANTKRLSQISSEVRDFAGKAKTKKLQPKDFDGNTFTISNLGMFGIDEFTAIINSPDSCIMAVGGIRNEPVVKNGEIVPGNRMKVTLSCDHRVVDGATGAEFLNTFKKFLENPVLLLGEHSI